MAEKKYYVRGTAADSERSWIVYDGTLYTLEEAEAEAASCNRHWPYYTYTVEKVSSEEE